MKRKLTALLLTLCIAFTCAMPSYAYTAEEQYEIMQGIIDFIKRYGLESSMDDDPLKRALISLFEKDPAAFNALMSAMLENYDSHSMFLPEGTYSDSFPTTSSYVGIGVTMEVYDGDIRVAEVNEQGSAYKAGVKAGDIFVSVDGTPTRGLSLEDVGALVRGEEGTVVKLVVRRAGKELTFNLKRSYIGVPNFTSRVVEDGVYYMNFARFADDATFIQFVFAMQDMVKSNTRALILDLRGNPGGEVNMALNILNRLLPDQTNYFAIATRDGGSRQYQVFTSDGMGPRLNKIIVLSDRNSASASEIIQVSLCDLQYAVSVGETTYGKARGQHHIVFEDGSAAVLTSVELIAPSTPDYEGVGLKPTYPVQNYTVPHPAAACDKLRDRFLNYTNSSDDGKRLNQALAALGYLSKTTHLRDFDEVTLDALNSFQLDCGLKPTRYLDSGTIAAINQKLASYAGSTVVYDAQYAKALELARQYAAQPQQYTVDEFGNFTNLEP